MQAMRTRQERPWKGERTLRVRAMQEPSVPLPRLRGPGGMNKCQPGSHAHAKNVEAVGLSLTGFIRSAGDAVVSSRMNEMKRPTRPKHPLNHLRPTLDLIYLLDNKKCWLCNGFVDRKAASLDHAVPKKYMGELRTYHSFSNYYLAHKKCNRVRGCEMPTQDIIRWDRLTEDDHEFIRRLFQIMEPHWGKPTRAVRRFLNGTSSRIPYTRRR